MEHQKPINAVCFWVVVGFFMWLFIGTSHGSPMPPETEWVTDQPIISQPVTTASRVVAITEPSLGDWSIPVDPEWHGWRFHDKQTECRPTPLPPSAWLLGAGMLGILVVRKKTRG